MIVILSEEENDKVSDNDLIRVQQRADIVLVQTYENSFNCIKNRIDGTTGNWDTSDLKGFLAENYEFTEED